MLKTVLLKQNSIIKFSRNMAVAPQTKESSDRIKAWQVHSYGEDLLCTSIRNPIISSPANVLVKIEASSMNPLDILMKEGYGRTLNKVFNWRGSDLILPLTLGRDFSGTVVEKGHGVGNDFQIGDKVYGVIPFHKHGSHAEFAVVDKTHIVPQPSALTHTEAASIPYTALTAYAALWITGGLSCKNPKGMKILILGASGGVGTSAVQMLRAVGATVVGTCSADAVPLVQGLGADSVFDYRDPNYIQNVASQNSYDIILDCAQFGYENIPSTWKYSSFITLNSPLLKHTDQYGLVGGLIASAANLIPANVCSWPKGKSLKWAYFTPSADGLKFVDKLVRNNELIPIIHKVYKFEEMPQAYKAMNEGHVRGKIVIDMLN